MSIHTTPPSLSLKQTASCILTPTSLQLTVYFLPNGQTFADALGLKEFKCPTSQPLHTLMPLIYLSWSFHHRVNRAPSWSGAEFIIAKSIGRRVVHCRVVRHQVAIADLFWDNLPTAFLSTRRFAYIANCLHGISPTLFHLNVGELLSRWNV